MNLTKKIQIFPKNKALKKFWNVSFLCTNIFNAGLEQRRDKKTWGKINIFSQKKELAQLKKDLPEYKLPSSQVLQNVLFALDRGYKMFSDLGGVSQGRDWGMVRP